MTSTYATFKCANFPESTAATPPILPLTSTVSSTRNRSSSKRETSSTAVEWPYNSARTNKPRSYSYTCQPSALDSYTNEENYCFSARLVGDEHAPLSTLEAWPLEPNGCTLLTPVETSILQPTIQTPTKSSEKAKKSSKKRSEVGKDSSEWVDFSASSQSSDDDWIAF